MLWRSLLIASLVLSVDVDRIKGEESKVTTTTGEEEEEGEGGDPHTLPPIIHIEIDAVPSGVSKEEGSGNGFSNNGKDDDWEEEIVEVSGGGIPRESVPGNQHQPPSVEKDFGDEEDGKNGGAGIVFEETKDVPMPEDADRMNAEPVSVDENNLLSHPAVIAAIVVGGFLVLVCLVLFFVLIVCCVRKKDEGTYNLDKAMKEKLQYITYTKADASEREFFA